MADIGQEFICMEEKTMQISLGVEIKSTCFTFNHVSPELG